MAVLVLKFFKYCLFFFLIFITEYVAVISSYSLGCKQSWYLTYDNSSIENYTITVEPDQVYNLRSPQLYRLTYPSSSLFTWHVHPYKPNSVSMMMYLLFIKTEGYCDNVRLEVDDIPIDITNNSVKTTDNVAYWSGGFEYSYDYRLNKQIFISTYFMEGRHAVVQFNTDYGWSDVGFVIRVLPLLNNRSKKEGGALNTRLSADSCLQQLELKPGPVDQDIKETTLIIKADDITRRVMVNILFMNVEHVNDCNQNFIKIYEGNSGKHELVTACRNMNTTSQPIQAVSVTNKLMIKYRCTTRQLYNQRHKIYTPSPCAVMNYHMYQPEDFEDRFYDSDDYVEYNYTDVPKLLEFSGEYLRFSIKSYHGVTFNFQSGKDEDLEDAITVHVFSRLMYPANPLFISHKLHGEPPKYSEYTVTSNILVDEDRFTDYWIAFEQDKITVGWGHELRKDNLLVHPLTGNLQLKYYLIKMYGSGTLRLYSDCDKNFVNQATQLPLGPLNSIEHTVSRGSIYTRIWTIKKAFPTQIVQFRVTSNLLHNPDCEWEGLTIYRGACPSWRKRVAVYCGRIEEMVSETTNSVVVIQFHTRADITAENSFPREARRYFIIEYQVYRANQEEPKKDGVNIGLMIAIVLSVVIISLVIAVVFFLQVVKKKSRKVTTEKILPAYPEQKVAHSQQIHQAPAQPIQLRINIDNASQMAGVPNVIYDSGSVQTSVNYTGIPPPAVYDPPRPSFPQNSLPPVHTVQPAS